MPDSLTLSWPEPDIALLTLDVPGKGVNLLSSAVLDEFAAALDQLEQRTDLAGVVLQSGKAGNFIAGADLNEVSSLTSKLADDMLALIRRGQQLWSRLAELNAVSVAAIDGVCLGGGTELSLWCDHRLVSDGPRTEIGLPEVKLGLLPGWGGTVRLPRIIGLPLAVEVIVRGEPLDAATAVSCGVATDRVPADRLLAAAIGLIRDEQARQTFRTLRERRKQPIDLGESEVELLRLNWQQRIEQETHGQNPVPGVILDHLLASRTLTASDALEREAQVFAQLARAPVSRALLNVHFLASRNKRDPGIDHAAFNLPPVRSLGIIGGGIMGAGIAAAAIRNGLPVVLTDTRSKVLEQMTPRILEEAAYDKHLKSHDPARAVALAALLNTGGESSVEHCDFVIEAIVENPDIKRQLFARLESRLNANAILASNTSTIPITRLAEDLQRPECFCGMHFFNPVRRMKLVEVIRGAKTSDETIARAVAMAKRIGKMPVVVNDGPGFMVNRLLSPYMNEAIELLHDGISIEQIDRAAVSFGMPLGPIALYDMVGLDTAMYAGRTMYQAFPNRVAASPLVPALVKRGRLGQKAGKGFFNYENPKKLPEADPVIAKLLDDYTRRKLVLTDDQVQNRLIMPMLLEATRLLEEHVARDVRDIDLGLIYGLGFPATKGGLLYWADTLGAKRILEILSPMESIGPRMAPTPMLRQMAETGGTFYR